jgi:hypothetical protein
MRARHRHFNSGALGSCGLLLDSRKISLADGTSISQWDDASGNARHAVQSTADQRPKLELGELNGNPVVRFDGSNDNLNTGNKTLLQNLASSTWFFVFKAAVNNATQRCLFAD